MDDLAHEWHQLPRGQSHARCCIELLHSEYGKEGTVWSDTMLGFDLETTGVDPVVDLPVSYALVRSHSGRPGETLSGLIDPGIEIPEGATAIHGITNEMVRRCGARLDDALALIVRALMAASAAGDPVVGMNVKYDLTMVNQLCYRFYGESLSELGWRGQVIDVLVLDRHFDRYRKGRRTLSSLCEVYGIELVHAHDATADVEASIAVLRAMCARYTELVTMDLGELVTSQRLWHRQWVDHFSEYRQKRGGEPLAPGEREWPVAPLAVAA